MNICVIPARGGSKRIPRKNIRNFCGKPIIAWSIEAARASGCFDHVIVSTDDLEIAEISRQWGGEAPFMRPAELADDYATTVPVIAHAVGWVNHNINSVEKACCIYATAPFITADNIQLGHRLLTESNTDFAFSVTSYAFPIRACDSDHFQSAYTDVQSRTPQHTFPRFGRGLA